MKFLEDIHPLTVHFPIAFLTLYCLTEIVSQFFRKDELKKLSLFFLVIGVLSATVSVLTGNMEFQTLTQNNSISQSLINEIGNHEYFATLTLWYFFFLLILKTYIILKKKNQSKLNYLFVIFAALGFYLIFTTSKIGGRLVYEFGIGTNLLK